MVYISISKYLNKYNHDSDEMIGEGSYSKVYNSDGHAIKYQGWTDSSAFIGELSVLCQYSHPNLIVLEDFTFNSEEGILVFPMGIMLKDAFESSQITIPEIINDLFSLLIFMEEQNICHGDIKLENCVFINGKLKLIDWGLVHFAENQQFSGVSYTPSYRDPEYRNDILMPLTVELFAIKTLIYDLLNLEFYKFEKVTIPFYPEISLEVLENVLPKSSDINVQELSSDAKMYHHLLQECDCKLSERKSASELSKLIPNFEKVPGVFVCHTPNLKKSLTKQYMTRKDLQKAVKHIMKMAAFLKFNANTLILAVKNYLVYMQRFKYIPKHMYKIACESSLFISQCLLESSAYDLNDWDDESEYSLKDLTYGVKNQIILLEGKLYSPVEKVESQNQLEHIIFNMIGGKELIPEPDGTCGDLIPKKFKFQDKYVPRIPKTKVRTLKELTKHMDDDDKYRFIVSKALTFNELPENLDYIFDRDIFTNYSICKRLNISRE